MRNIIHIVRNAVLYRSRAIITFKINTDILETISFRCSLSLSLSLSLEIHSRDSVLIRIPASDTMLISNQSAANNKGDPSDCYYVHTRASSDR